MSASQQVAGSDGDTVSDISVIGLLGIISAKNDMVEVAPSSSDSSEIHLVLGISEYMMFRFRNLAPNRLCFFC